MSGAIEKKKNETYDALVGAPATHIDTRSSILADIALSREFAQTYLQALCNKFTSSSGSYSLHQICETLAQQRAICYGANSLKTQVQKFDLPAYETVNGALTLTEANTSFFGYVATTLDGKNTITLQNTAGTQTIDGNTFSTRITDYYLVRSRVSGELETTSANLSAYTTPDGGDIVFGNAVAWVTNSASNIPSSEEEANTWNYHWARANVASCEIKNSGGVLELKTMTLADHLTAGSNTDYTPVGPGFNQSFYLKRHADAVNTFTITGTTAVNSVSITGVSEADLAKVKYGDVISGTGIPDDNVTIQAVQTEKNIVRLSETGVATQDGTITLTVNSVPVGHAAHDIFCEVKVSGEGLVANTTWAPVGDDAGNYATGSEDDLCVADTDDFKGLLNFFNPTNISAGKDLIKGCAKEYVSDGKEVNNAGNTALYPYITKNPFFPSTAGTTKAAETKSEGGKTIITGTQPSGLGDKDIWSGRFTRWDNKRENAAGDVHEYRYMIDNAEKFYYELSALAGFTCGSQTTPSAHAMPNANEPPKELSNKNALQLAIDDVLGSNDISIANNTPVVPVDSGTQYRSSGSGVGLTNGVTHNNSYGYFYKVEANNVITKYSVKETTTITNTTTIAYSYTNISPTPVQCVYNHVQGNLYHATAANTDVAAVETALTSLQGLDHFRDPIITGARSGSGISDSDFQANVESHATNGPNGTLTVLRGMQGSFRTAMGSSGRLPSHPEGAGSACITYVNSNGGSGGQAPTGSTVDYRAFTHSSATVNAWAQWVSFSTAWGTTLKGAIIARIAEIDARIGAPTRSTAAPASGRENPPTVTVSAIPASNTTGGFAPYGRSIYNGCNLLLGQDVNLLGGIIKDIESLTDLIDMVKNDRNKYEIYSGRDKEY